MTAFAAVKCDSNLIPSNYMLQHGYHLSELFLIGLKMLLFSHSLTHSSPAIYVKLHKKGEHFCREIESM